MKPLDDAIRQKLLPTVTGQNAFNDLDRQLLALPVRHDGAVLLQGNFNVKGKLYKTIDK